MKKNNNPLFLLCIVLIIFSNMLSGQEAASECSTCIIKDNTRPRGERDVCMPNPATENMNEHWGPVSDLTVGGRTFRLYNFSPPNIIHIQNALSVLPPSYLDALPNNIRSGNPLGTLIREPNSGGRSIGACHICKNRNRIPEAQRKDYEFISFHPGIFDEATRYVTIFHEFGHFIDYEHHLTQAFSSTHREQLDTYSTTVYNSRLTRPRPMETTASGIAYYFARAYTVRRNGTWRGTFTRPVTEERYYPTWLHELVSAHVEAQ